MATGSRKALSLMAPKDFWKSLAETRVILDITPIGLLPNHITFCPIRNFHEIRILWILQISSILKLHPHRFAQKAQKRSHCLEALAEAGDERVAQQLGIAHLLAQPEILAF